MERMTVNSPRNPTSVPLVDQLARRWSPRGFDVHHVISDDDLTALGEAARWAPSASNDQPTRFIVARRGTPTFELIHSTLREPNQAWAGRASALIVAIAVTSRDGRRLRFAEYDLGQAIAHLTVEAEARGLNVRQMGGFDVESARTTFDLASELMPVTVVAVGKHDASEAIPDAIRESDSAPRRRRELDDLTLVLDV